MNSDMKKTFNLLVRSCVENIVTENPGNRTEIAHIKFPSIPMEYCTSQRANEISPYVALPESSNETYTSE